LFCDEYSDDIPPGLPDLATVLGIERQELFALEHGGERLMEPPDEASGHYLTTLTLATIIKRACPDLEVRILDLQRIPKDDFSLTEAERADLLAVGISTTFLFTASDLSSACQKLRRELPGIPIVVGGAGITLNPSWFEHADADYAVISDAEDALPQLLSHLLSGSPGLTTIPNLHFRGADGAITVNERVNFPCDDIPTPDWSLIGDGRWPSATYYESQRGCAFRCTFCSYPSQAMRWKYKSAQRMVEEFDFYSRRGIKEIRCFDSTMVTPPKRMFEFCELLTARGVQIKWSCYGHAQHLQKAELCQAMFDAGCTWVSIGVESADEGVLRLMKKLVTREKIERAVHNAQTAGIWCKTFFMVGFPGETPETHQGTVNTILAIQPDFLHFSSFEVRDRTIPILAMDNLNLMVSPGDRPDWKHDGMDRATAQRLADSAFWEVIFRSHRSVMMPLYMVCGMQFAAGSARAAQFSRETIMPILVSYGRYLALHPHFAMADDIIQRPPTVPGRSALAAERERDNLVRLWRSAQRSALLPPRARVRELQDACGSGPA
jgi:hypothetical protein